MIDDMKRRLADIDRQLKTKKHLEYFKNSLMKKKLNPCDEAYENRIKELQEQVFTKKEAEKIETFLIHGYQMIISKNKKIFSKLEKMKGEQ
jgi:hypothetical protein